MTEPGQRLSSWKEIAAYLGRTVRTCQRLEQSMGLPVHRLDGSSKAHVFAISGELDVWLAKKADEHVQKRSTPRLRMALLAAGAVVFAAAAVLTGALGIWRRAPSPWPAPGAKSVAVLPFTDLSPDPGWEYVAEGVSEALRNSLGRLRGLRVPGLDSTLAARDRMPDVREVGRLLGVEGVLDGTVQVLGGRLRVSARLVSAGDGRPIWSGPYDKRPEDILGIQDDIAWSVLTHLEVKLRSEEENALHKRPTENGRAYEAYLKGRYLIGHPRPDAPDAALGLFEEALRGDAGFAAAQAGIAAFYLNRAAPALRPLVGVDPRALSAEMSEKARPALSAALHADPDLAEARALDAAARFWFEWDWGGAEKGFRRALELRPGDTETRGTYAIYLLSMNRLERAREEIRLALAADPLSSLLRSYSLWIDLGSGRTEEALDEFERIARLEPGFELACTGAALAYLRKGDTKKAEETLRKAYSYPQQVPGRLDLVLAACYLKRGDRQGVAFPWGSLAETRERPSVSPVLMALAAAEQGDLYAAFDRLERARRERDPQMPFVRVYAEGLGLDLVRNPRFAAFLASLGPRR